MKNLLSTSRWPLVALLLIAGVYAASLPSYPGPSADNAEFQSLARTLGTSHPTGYPLYLLAAHVFQALVPVGTLAWQVNLFSGVCGLGALALLWRIGLRLGLAPWSVTLAMGWLATTSTWWRLSTVAEVYSLHVLLTLASLLCILKWRDLRDERFLRAAIFLHAVSYANHLTTLLVLPALLFLVAATDRRVFTTPAIWRWCALSILAGLSFYAYVVIQSRTAPVDLVYSPIHNLHDLRAYITGAAFHTSFSVQSNAEAFTAHVRYIPHLLWQEWGWMMLPMGAGLLAAGGRDGPGWRMLGVLLGIQTGMVFLYRIPDIQDYLLVPAAAGALAVAWGVQRVRTWASHSRMRTAMAALAALFVLGQAARTAYGVAIHIRYRGGQEDADILARQTSLHDGKTLLLLPHAKQYQIARYYLFGEGRGAGQVRAELWQADQILPQAPAEVRKRLADAARQYDRILAYGRPGNPGYDLPAILTAKGARVRPVSPFIWEVDSSPAPSGDNPVETPATPTANPT